MDEDVRSGVVRSNMSEVTRNMKSQTEHMYRTYYDRVVSGSYFTNNAPQKPPKVDNY